MSLLSNMLSRFGIAFIARSQHLLISWLQSPPAVTVKCLPTIRETWVQSLGQVGLLGKEMAIQSCILAWKIPWIEEPGRLQSMVCKESDMTERLHSLIHNVEPWHTPFLILTQFVVPCPVLTDPSWPAYRFLRKQVRRSGIPISWRIFHSLLWSTQSKTLGSQWSRSFSGIPFIFFLSFFSPMDVGNLICGSSAFSKSSLYIWKFLFHILLKTSLENFEH